MFTPSAATTIFVSIAAYRDSETPLTVADLYAKADHPERIFVGVLNQLELPGDSSWLVSGHPNVRQKVVSHSESKGACWARHTVFAELMEQEDFCLQIDSHMRFDPGWDTRMLNQWNSADDPMAVLTHYPMPYDSHTNVCRPQMYTQFNCSQFDQWGLPKVTSAALALMDGPPVPKYTVFLAAGCFFCPAQVVREVEYDPYLYFNGEEINYAVRLWTHGYNLYLPNHPFLYHDYGVNRGRKMHSVDNPSWTQTHELAVQRLMFLLGISDSASPEALVEIRRYGLGTARTLQEWQFRHGIHFRRQLLCQNVLSGEFQ